MTEQVDPFKHGFKPDAAFYENVQHLRALRTFVRSLPFWCQKHDKTISFHLHASKEGVEISIGLPEGSKPEDATSALEAIAQAERLMEMESTIEALRFFGGASERMTEILNHLIEESEQYAAEIYPPHQSMPGFDALNGPSTLDGQNRSQKDKPEE